VTRYFFHSANGTHHLDDDGMELPSLDAAHEEAVKWMAELLNERPEDFWSTGNLAIFVTDDHWRLLFSVTTMCAEVPGADEVIDRRRQQSNTAEPTH